MSYPEWVQLVAMAVAGIGAELCQIQRALVKHGFAAFEPAQSHLFAKAQSEAERDELRKYLCEIAKETLGSIKRPGSIAIAGDAYVSDYLEELRQARNARLGGVEAYQTSPRPWEFELNPVLRRIATERAELPEVWRKERNLVSSEVQLLKAAEQERHGGAVPGDYGSASRRTEVLLEAIRRSISDQGAVQSKRRLKRNSVLATIAISDNWTAILCLTNASSFSPLGGGGACVLDLATYIVGGAVSSMHKIETFLPGQGFHLKAEQIIYGFPVYFSARSLGEIALCIQARLTLLKILIPRLVRHLPT